ncbi:MAG: 1-deoxy-D-xylulose-5-phosphate synthase N-terminal domain-containing protein, partial [PS1 clade bacterium]
MLSQIKSPADIKNIEIDKLQDLAEEVREFLIENVQKTGGHLA